MIKNFALATIVSFISISAYAELTPQTIESNLKICKSKAKNKLEVNECIGRFAIPDYMSIMNEKQAAKYNVESNKCFVKYGSIARYETDKALASHTCQYNAAKKIMNSKK